MAAPLKRRIGPWLLTAYGVGVMVGAGIYVIVGVVAENAGFWAPLAFLLAGLVALPSALAYAEFSTRIPEAAGEAAYVAAGFGRSWMGVLVGLAIVVSGMISAATVLRGGVGYLQVLLDVDRVVLSVAIGVALTAIAIVGVLESMVFVAVFTAIEVSGLALVIWAGFAAEPVAGLASMVPPVWTGIASAIALCFFAFIGFEDIVNMAEETREPERTLPHAILWSLAITAVLYALVSYVTVRSVPVDQLGASEQPLALVWEAGMGSRATFLSAIAVFAAVNGVLAQIVMAARVLFGLGRRNRALSFFFLANPRFGTPVRATLLVGIVVIVGAVALPVVSLARITSAVLLVVFMLVNIALIVQKRRQPEAPFRIPNWVPWAGAASAATALYAEYGVLE